MQEPTSTAFSSAQLFKRKKFLWQKRSERVPLQFDQYYHHVAVTMKEHQRRTTMLLGVTNQMFWRIALTENTELISSSSL